MTDYQIPAAAIEAAQKAGLKAQLEVAHGSGMTEAEGRFYAMQAAIRAAFDELGMVVDDDDGHNTMYRLVSKWMKP